MKNNLFLSLLLALFILPSLLLADYANEWRNFKPGDAGISEGEFELVKKNGMSRKKLLDLVEYGIMPTEYFDKPWEKLGISEEKWVSGRKAGLENADLEHTGSRSAQFNTAPLISFFLPGFYAYRSDRLYHGLSMSGLATLSLAGLIFHQNESKPDNSQEAKKSTNFYYLIPLLGSMLWSSADAWYYTQHRFNPDANRFTLLPLPQGVVLSYTLKF